MTTDLGELCRSCGLCCDGSLFGRVPLEPDEVGTARRHRLAVVGANAFEQPCTALSGEPRSCAVYEQRPASCRRFTCSLYERHRRDGGELEPRIARVHRVRELLAELHARGLNAADYAELQERLEADFARAPITSRRSRAAT